MNAKTMTKGEIAKAVNEAVGLNRWFANKQIDKNTFNGNAETFADYKGTISALTVACYNHVVGKVSINVVAKLVGSLFEYFGIEAKPNNYTKRFIVASVQMKRCYSAEYLKAKTEARHLNDDLATMTEALIKAKPELNTKTNSELCEEYAAIAEKTKAVNAAEAEVEKLLAEPKNCYIDYKCGARAVGKTGSMRFEATKQVMKNIEDVLADIIAEREIMTTKELLIEAETLKAERKNRHKIDKMTEEQALEALGISINATAK